MQRRLNPQPFLSPPAEWRRGFLVWDGIIALSAFVVLLLASAHSLLPASPATASSSPEEIQATFIAGPFGESNPRLWAALTRSRSIPTLLNGLGQSRSWTRQITTIVALVDAPDSALPLLAAGLHHRDPAVRMAIAQVLGWRGSLEAQDMLLNATFDDDIRVRQAAALALGQIGARRALPRLQQLQLVQPDFYLQEAGYLAEQQITARIADELSLGSSQIRGLAVASATGWTFALTPEGLRAWKGNGWQPLPLPEEPMEEIATTADGRTVYVNTRAGLFRSSDGGEMWVSLQSRLPALLPAQVTALTVNPANPRQVFLALGAASGGSLGIYASADGGDQWIALPESPDEYVTTRLSLDPARPSALFGQTRIGTWRYTLPQDISNPSAAF